MKSLKKLFSSLITASIVVSTAMSVTFADTLIPINEAYFPDEGFRSFVSSNFDRNGDGVLSEEEINSVTSLQIYYSQIPIYSLEGIELFSSLRELRLGIYTVTSIDISHNPCLVSAYQNNPISYWNELHGHNETCEIQNSAVNVITDCQVNHHPELNTEIPGGGETTEPSNPTVPGIGEPNNGNGNVPGGGEEVPGDSGNIGIVVPGLPDDSEPTDQVPSYTGDAFENSEVISYLNNKFAENRNTACSIYAFEPGSVMLSAGSYVIDTELSFGQQYVESTELICDLSQGDYIFYVPNNLNIINGLFKVVNSTYSEHNVYFILENGADISVQSTFAGSNFAGIIDFDAMTNEHDLEFAPHVYIFGDSGSTISCENSSNNRILVTANATVPSNNVSFARPYSYIGRALDNNGSRWINCNYPVYDNSFVDVEINPGRLGDFFDASSPEANEYFVNANGVNSNREFTTLNFNEYSGEIHLEPGRYILSGTMMEKIIYCDLSEGDYLFSVSGNFTMNNSAIIAQNGYYTGNNQIIFLMDDDATFAMHDSCIIDTTGMGDTSISNVRNIMTTSGPVFSGEIYNSCPYIYFLGIETSDVSPKISVDMRSALTANISLTNGTCFVGRVELPDGRFLGRIKASSIVSCMGSNVLHIAISDCMHHVSGEINDDIKYDPFEIFVDPNLASTVLFYFDSNGDGLLSVNELNMVTALDVHGMNITSLEGLQYLSRLEYLDCRDCNITVAKVSDFPNSLQTIHMEGNNTQHFILDGDTNDTVFRAFMEGEYYPAVTDEYDAIEYDFNIDYPVPAAVFGPMGARNIRFHFSWTFDSNIEVRMVNRNPYGTVTFIPVTSYYFPDSSFREAIIEEVDNITLVQGAFADYYFIGMIDFSNIYELSLSDRNISSLEGIEYFFALRTLDCSNNSIEELDVSNFVSLQELNCSNNNISELDLYNNQCLKTLDCSNNNIESLLFADVSPCSGDCYVCNELRRLNLNHVSGTVVEVEDPWGNTSYECNCPDSRNSRCNAYRYLIESIDCSNNNISEFNISSCPNLSSLNCSNNYIEIIHIGNNTTLKNVYEHSQGVETDGVVKYGLSFILDSDVEIITAIRSLNDANIVGFDEYMYYTGSPIVFDFEIDYEGEKLIEGVDYEVLYADNTEVGTGVVFIRGIGDYKLEDYNPESFFRGEFNIIENMTSETLLGHNLSLDGSIGVNFYFTFENEMIVDPEVEGYIEFTLDNGTVTDVPLSEGHVDTSTVPGTTCYVYTCRVAAAEMSENITAQIILPFAPASDEEERSKPYHYTVQDYIDYIEEHQDEPQYAAVIDLMDAMSVYGEFADCYFSDESSSIPESVMSAISEVTAETLVAYEPYSHVQGNQVEYVGSNLFLQSETTLRLYFVVPSDIDDVAFYMDGIELDSFRSGSYYCVDIANIPAAELDDIYEIEIRVNGETDGYISHSVLAYCYGLLRYEPDEVFTVELQNMIRALYLYNVAANEYFGR